MMAIEDFFNTLAQQDLPSERPWPDSRRRLRRWNCLVSCGRCGHEQLVPYDPHVPFMSFYCCKCTHQTIVSTDTAHGVDSSRP